MKVLPTISGLFFLLATASQGLMATGVTPTLADGQACWSGAYDVTGKSGVLGLHCSPDCTEGCVAEFWESSSYGDVVVCNCDDEGDPTDCCQIVHRLGGQTPIGSGSCGTECDTFPVCRTYVVSDGNNLVYFASCAN